MAADTSVYEWFSARLDAPAETSEWLTVTQDMINRFADVTGDHQWIHVDPMRAKAESPFGGAIAHGFLVLSLVAGLFSPIPVGSPATTGLNYGLDRLRFTAPVREGSRIRAHRRLLAVERAPGNGAKVTIEVTVEIEGGQKPALVASLIAMFFG